MEALNGFIVCRHFHYQHDGLILVCEGCGKVAELEARPWLAKFVEAAAAAEFIPDAHSLLITGKCKACHE